MDNRLVVHCISLLIFLHSIESHTTNGTDSLPEDALRVPRVSGRIVKIYSGSRPDPIHCTGEGFQGDPNNCAVFYRCMKSGNGKFSVFRFQCGPGTVYDPDTEVCNHPRSTRRKECGGLIESSIDQTHINEIDNAQPEIPSPIVTKQPVYTKSTIASKPVISTRLTTQVSQVSTVFPWRTSSVRSTKNDFTITTKPSTEKTSTVAQIYDNSNKRTEYPNYSHQPTSQSTETSSVTRKPNDDICISDGFMGDSKNCRRFYRCVSDQRGGYIKYEFSCSESTMWDDDIQSCNHPWAVKRSRCGKSSNTIHYVDSSNFTFNIKTTTQQQSKTTSYPNQTEKEKSQNNEINSSSQHQTQIIYGSKFPQMQTEISNGPVTHNQSRLNYGNRISETIPNMAEQNQTQISKESAISQVQMQTDYGEEGVQTQLQINHSNPSSQMQVQINDISTKMPTTMKYYDLEKENYKTHVQSNNCTQSGFMGDDYDCKKFYRCVDNGKGSYMRYEFSCGEGTVWDAKIEACNHAWAVKECGGKLSTEPQNTEPSTTTLSQTYYTTPTKSTQNYFTPTSTFVADIDDDSGYGNHIQQHTTTYPTAIKETTAKPSIQENNGCKSSGFINDVNNCKTFYRCVDNGKGSFTKYEFHCGEGTVWDPDIEACNHAWAVKNCGSVGANIDKIDTTTNSVIIDLTSQVVNTVSIQTTTQKHHEDDEYDTGYNESNNNEKPQITSSSTKKPQNQDITDNICKSSGFMGDENDCSKFYRCVHKGDGTYVRYEFTCGEGTVWDPKIEACNHPWAVEKCGGSGSDAAYNETSSESSSTIGYEEIESGYPTQSDKNTDIPTKSTSTIKSTTSVIDIENNNCKKSGFMGDNNDCKKFYRCVDKGDGSYIRYEFSCGEGTVWDPKIEACNHAWAVEKCGSVSETTNVKLITSENPIWSDEEINNGYPSQHQNDEELDKITSNPIFESTTVLENSVCKNTGFIGDKYDCKKFYRCVDDGKGGFIKYEFSCGDGTVWDQSIESCNHVGSVKDCGISINQSSPIYSEGTTQNVQTTISEIGSNGYYPQVTEGSVPSTIEEPQGSVASNVCTKEGFIGDKNDCKKFYRCVDNSSGGFIKYEFVCGEGTVWVQDIQACDHATLDQPCGSSTLEISKEPSHENDEIDMDTSIKTSTTSSTQISVSTQASENPQSSSFVCKSEGFFGDFDDCMKFYRCVNNGKESFTKYDFICGEGTFWDQDIQACNHKTESNNCTKIQTSSTTLATESNIEYSTTTSIIQQQSSTEKLQISNSSKDDKCISEGFYSNSNDCSKFHRCVSDGKGGYIKYDFSCGEGTVWVQDIQACDYDDNIATCNKQNGVTKPQTIDEIQSSTHAPDLLTSTSSESQTPEKQDDEYPQNEPISNGQCLSEGFHANNNDCRQFYRCVDDGHGGFTKYDFVCGEGTAWDENIQSCNHINEVKSCHVSIHEESHTQSIMQDEEISQTEGSTSTTKKTPSENTESTTTVSNNKCEKEGYFGNTEDCKQFYRCVDNGNGGLTKYEFTCGDGTIWDQDITTCNHPEDVTNPSCKQKQPSTTSAPSSSTISQSSTSAIESTNQNSNCSQEQSSKKPMNKNITCDKAGYYGDPNDCKKFYRCVDWDGDGQRFSVFHFDCGEGTIWDPALDTCNHEESVYPPRDCSGTQSQNEVITEDTTTTSQEKTTTEKSTTTEQSTTQQTGTSEYTTTQQSTTSEHTTTQQTTTSEQTTTQKSTDSVQTTTQQSTISEQTTTQQATTSEQTATQTSTSTEQTTTQQPTATEQTTMQQTTSSEPTTTRQSTTSEETTTQQTINSEPTTTQQSTTSEKTTTQQSTSTDSTTTQQSTSSEQTSTQQSTTIQDTTAADQSTVTTTQQSIINEQTTTEKTTTSESTTQQSTTNENSKEELTSTEQSTTEQSLDGTTTDQQTSDASIAEQSSSTTEQSNEGTTTTEGKQDTTTEESSSNKECPDTEENQYLYVCPTSFRRHPKYCNLFYQCTEDDDNHDNKIAVFTCPNNTIYDESKTQCVEEEKADKKCDGQIAQRRRFKRLDTIHKEPIVVGKEKQSCPTVGNLPFEKRVECSSAFLKCMKSKSGVLRGFVYKCPEGYMYWTISRRCELIGNISDCKRSNNNWDKRWEFPIEKTNIDAYKYKLIRPNFN